MTDFARDTTGACSEPTRRLSLLVWPAASLLLVCVYCAFLQPQTPGRMIRASASLIPELPLWAWLSRPASAVVSDITVVSTGILAMSALGFAAYAVAIWLAWGAKTTRAGMALVTSVSLVLCTIAVFALPTSNTDIYNYIVNGRIAAVHHSNPYYTPAEDFPDDPIYPYASPRQLHVPGDAKLPAWTLISTGLAWLGGDDPVTNLLLYRSAFLAMTMVNLLLVALVLRRLEPNAVLGGCIAYGWNPIVLTLGQSKTDTAMVSFLLLSVLLLVAAHRRSAIAALAVSALVKLITAPLGVVYGLGELRRGRWRELAAAATLGAAIILVFFAFFSQDGALVTHLARWGSSSGQAAGGWLRPLLKWGFVALVAVVGLTQDGDPKTLLRGWVVVMLYFCLFLGKFAFAWYLLSLIALAALVPDWRLTTMMVALSFSAFTLDLWYRTSTQSFRLSATLPVPRLAVYIALPAAAAAVIGFVMLVHRRNADQCGTILRPGPLRDRLQPGRTADEREPSPSAGLTLTGAADDSAIESPPSEVEHSDLAPTRHEP